MHFLVRFKMYLFLDYIQNVYFFFGTLLKYYYYSLTRTRYSNIRVRGMHTVPGDNARMYFSKKGVNVHFSA